MAQADDGWAFCIAVFAMMCGGAEHVSSQRQRRDRNDCTTQYAECGRRYWHKCGQFICAPYPVSNTNLNYIQMYDGNGGMNFFTYYGIGVPTKDTSISILPALRSQQ